MAIGRIPEPGTGIPESIIAAKGDLLTGTANDTPAVLSVGANGTTLVADSGAATGLAWKVDPVADLVTTAGDTLYATAADTLVRLGIGTAGQVLQVNSGATAPEWATPSGGGSGLTRLTTLNPSAVSETIADSVFSSTYDSYMIVGYLNLTDNANLTMQLRSGGSNLTTNTYVTSQFGATTNYTQWFLSDNIASDKDFMFTLTLSRPFLATEKQGVFQIARETAASYQSGIYEPTATSRDGFRLFVGAGTFTGQVVVYGLAE